MTPRTALVVGATGLVGGHVARCLAARPEWARIVVLARRPADTASARVERRVVDFDALGPADVEGATCVFACLGTTIKKAGSEAAFRKVDHDYTVRVAELAKAAGAERFALVSSVGAAPLVQRSISSQSCSNPVSKGKWRLAARASG